MIVRTRVDVDLRAFHTDPYLDEGRHEHVWNVQAVFDGTKFADARALRLALANLLSVYQGKDLPPELWSGEDIARMVVNVLGTGDPIGCVVTSKAVGCVVTRPGFAAEAWA